MPKASDRELGHPATSKSRASGILATTSRPPGPRNTAGASMMPSMAATDLPTEAPSIASTTPATALPSMMLFTTSRPPGQRSTARPSNVPTAVPSEAASSVASPTAPTGLPTTSRPPGPRGMARPSVVPTSLPSSVPTSLPCAVPTAHPTTRQTPDQRDTANPSAVPTPRPAATPRKSSITVLAMTNVITPMPAQASLASVYVDPADVAAAERQTRYATLCPQEQREQDRWVQTKVPQMAPCPVGFAWSRDPEGCPGYRCHGEHHYISDMSFAEGHPALYYYDWERDRAGRLQNLDDNRFSRANPRDSPQRDRNPPRHIPRGFVGPVFPERWDDALGRWVWPRYRPQAP